MKRITFLTLILSTVAMIAYGGQSHVDKHTTTDGSIIRYSTIEKSGKSQLTKLLAEYVAGKNGRIGVAVIVDHLEAASVNGNQKFEMMSVVKFPLALAVADYCDKAGISFSDSVDIKSSEMVEGTWSPMALKYGNRDLRLPILELLEYALIDSDNNACDALIKLVSGVEAVGKYVKSLGMTETTIGATEADMHHDRSTSKLNSTTPSEMAFLFDRFETTLRHENSHMATIADILERCATGTNRLPSALPAQGITIGHKTGTGFTMADGNVTAVNDAGYVVLPDGSHYSIAVFVGGGYDMRASEKIISDIAKIVYDQIGDKKE